MPAEEGTEDFEAEIRAATAIRSSSCTVCDWIADRDDAEKWDRIMAGPTRVYGHKAIWKSMTDRGYTAVSSKPIESHRQRQHRVG